MLRKRKNPSTDPPAVDFDILLEQARLRAVAAQSWLDDARRRYAAEPDPAPPSPVEALADLERIHDDQRDLRRLRMLWSGMPSLRTDLEARLGDGGDIAQREAAARQTLADLAKERQAVEADLAALLTEMHDLAQRAEALAAGEAAREEKAVPL